MTFQSSVPAKTVVTVATFLASVEHCTLAVLSTQFRKMSHFSWGETGRMGKGICTVANLGSLQKLRYVVLLKTGEPARDVSTGRGREMSLLITSFHLDTRSTEKFMLVLPTQPEYHQLVYKCFVLGVAVNVTSPHPEMRF